MFGIFRSKEKIPEDFAPLIHMLREFRKETVELSKTSKDLSKEVLRLRVALATAQGTLQLIAAPKRPDGTYNRDREACGRMAEEACKLINETLNGRP